jgi:hypothetical protein
MKKNFKAATQAVNESFTFIKTAGTDLSDRKIDLFIKLGDEQIPELFLSSISKRIEKKGGTVVDDISIKTDFDQPLDAL